MTVSEESKQRLEEIADDTLTTFRRVADAAEAKLRDGSAPSTEVFASTNTLTSTAVENLAHIYKENRESYQHLAREPAIARVVVVDDAGNKNTYYICRATPILGMASYRSPVGRLASLPIGESLSLPKGRVEVLEHARLRPALIDDDWDSRNTVLEGDSYGPVTVESLRALLGTARDEDLVGRLLAEEGELANVREGIRRSVITKMGLRDQPVLDQYQDEIFRLPLDSRLLVLGPPGTGKTTTLIRRLGQKLDAVFLDESELRAVESAGIPAGTPHAQSWLMFAPTELLKQYVKEAFAREGIPASEQRITTWSDYRRELARRVFGVLRSASGRGTFVLKESMQGIAADSQENAIAWFSDFDKWHKEAFINDLRLAAQELSEDPSKKTADLGHRLLSIVRPVRSTSVGATFASLSAEVAGIQNIISAMKEITDKKIRGVLNLQLNSNKDFLDQLAGFIDALQESTASEIEDPDDQEGDEEEEVDQPRTGRAAALLAYTRAVRAQARAQARKRSVGKASRNGKIIEWLGERTLGASNRMEVGASLLVQGRARRFVNPVKRYLDGIPMRYRAFRRLRQSEGKWYAKEGFSQTDIHPLELDIVLLAILRNARELLGTSAIIRDIDAPVWASLKPTYALYRNQILVDEVADFSPIQIACMAAIGQPRIQSFFACGDFNQRVTTWGSRSVEDIKWALPEIEVKYVKVSYRHSRQLNELARAIVRGAGGRDAEVVLPDDVDSEGVPPVLLEGAAEQTQVIGWLVRRIIEIESFVQQLPSIAIFVDHEEGVQRVAQDLNEALGSQNIRVVACPNGQVMGQDNDVRVFDVQHIKGLEFEAAFFIGIDRLARRHPDLFDKYLYVGVTRAATYLGLTCDAELPATMAELRPMFAHDWANT